MGNNSILESVLHKIEAVKTSRILIAIDGRCASGKTTLAMDIKNAAGGNVIHVDHFFLPPDLRTEARLSEPGGNVDYERFLKEALQPLTEALPFSYKPFNCATRQFGDSIQIQPHRINIIEGAYSCHPLFIGSYNLKIFLTVDKAEQLRRIQQRNGEAAALNFVHKWIPLEEQYFEFFKIDEQCDIKFDSTEK